MLGRGRLQYPSKGVDAVIHFVRNRLLPQDQVAVMAFNRASEFTTNRAATLQVLERFKSRHEDIEAGFRHQMSGLAALYGSLDPAAALQREIDAIFEGSEGRTTRAVPPAQTSELQQATTAARRAADNVARADIIAGREQTIGDTFNLFAGEMVGMPFEQYVSTSVETLHDLGTLYTGIEYLHFLEGEKHILFLTELGFYSPAFGGRCEARGAGESCAGRHRHDSDRRHRSDALAAGQRKPRAGDGRAEAAVGDAGVSHFRERRDGPHAGARADVRADRRVVVRPPLRAAGDRSRSTRLPASGTCSATSR